MTLGPARSSSDLASKVRELYTSAGLARNATIAAYGDERMWTWVKYLYLAIRLGTLFEKLKAVRPSDPAVTSESYQPASAAILDDSGVQRWLGRLCREEQHKFLHGLPVSVCELDAVSEDAPARVTLS